MIRNDWWNTRTQLDYFICCSSFLSLIKVSPGLILHWRSLSSKIRLSNHLSINGLAGSKPGQVPFQDFWECARAYSRPRGQGCGFYKPQKWRKAYEKLGIFWHIFETYIWNLKFHCHSHQKFCSIFDPFFSFFYEDHCKECPLYNIWAIFGEICR